MSNSGWLNYSQLEKREEVIKLCEQAEKLLAQADEILTKNEMEYVLTRVVKELKFCLKLMRGE